MVKCSNIKFHFNHKIFFQSNMGSMNSISLRIMAGIYLCAGLGKSGISVEKCKERPTVQGLLHACLHRAIYMPGPSSYIWGGLVGICFPFLQTGYSLLEYGPIHPTHSLLGNINPPPATWFHPDLSPIPHDYCSSSRLGSPLVGQFPGQLACSQGLFVTGT